MKDCCRWLPEAVALGGVALGVGLALRGWPEWPFKNPQDAVLAAWAGALGSTLAAVAAVLAAFVPIIVARRRAREDGAIAAASIRNTIQIAQSALTSAAETRGLGPQGQMSAEQFLQNCLNTINTFPVESIRNYSVVLAQHLLIAKSQVVVLVQGFRHDTIWNIGCAAASSHLNAYVQKLGGADAVVQELIRKDLSRS